MRVMNRNWSATKQRLHPQSVAKISRHSVLSGDRVQQCGTLIAQYEWLLDDLEPCKMSICTSLSASCKYVMFVVNFFSVTLGVRPETRGFPLHTGPNRQLFVFLEMIRSGTFYHTIFNLTYELANVILYPISPWKSFGSVSILGTPSGEMDMFTTSATGMWVCQTFA